MRFLHVRHGKFRAIVHHPNGRWLISGHGGGAIVVWDLMTGEELLRGGTEASGLSVNQLILMPDTKGLVVGHNRGCDYWRLTSKRLRLARESIGPSTMVSAGRHLVGHLKDGSAVLDIESPLVYQLNIEGGPTRRWVLGTPTRQLTRGVLHPNGRLLALSDSSGTIRVWDLDALDVLPFTPPWTGNRFNWGRQPKLAGTAVIRLNPDHPDDEVGALRFTADGSLLFAAVGGTVSVWEVESWERVCRIHVTERHVRAAAISPDGRQVLATGSDSEVRVYDAETGLERGRFAFDIGKIARLAFAPDGLTAVACGGGLRAIVWDVE